MAAPIMCEVISFVCRSSTSPRVFLCNSVPLSQNRIAVTRLLATEAQSHGRKSTEGTLLLPLEVRRIPATHVPSHPLPVLPTCRAGNLSRTCLPDVGKHQQLILGRANHLVPII